MNERDFLERYLRYLDGDLDRLAPAQERDLDLMVQALENGQYPKNRLDMALRSKELRRLGETRERVLDRLSWYERWDMPRKRETQEFAQRPIDELTAGRTNG